MRAAAQLAPLVFVQDHPVRPTGALPPADLRRALRRELAVGLVDRGQRHRLSRGLRGPLLHPGHAGKAALAEGVQAGQGQRHGLHQAAKPHAAPPARAPESGAPKAWQFLGLGFGQVCTLWPSWWQRLHL